MSSVFIKLYINKTNFIREKKSRHIKLFSSKYHGTKK
jgi:hypothetical protein